MTTNLSDDKTKPLNPLPRHTTPGWQRFMRFFARLIMLPIARLDMQGMEHVPPDAFMGVCNHLSSFDTLTLIAIGPLRRISLFAAIEHRSDFIAGWALNQLRVIWLRRGEADREAIKIALDEIKAGSAFGIAIEGTRSKTGALIEGKTGAAYLATRANIPILPAVIWGTEQIKHNLRRFKRTTVHIRIGEPFHLPEGRAGTEQLQQYTDQIMLKMASMLPSEYWGVYAEKMNEGMTR
jgi:1-acyl-sn-glycerol-3-phosphate acyltransferase